MAKKVYEKRGVFDASYGHPIRGGAVSQDGSEYIFGSISGASILSVGREFPDVGTFSIMVPAPWGQASGVAYRHSGPLHSALIVWTAIEAGEVWMRWPTGLVEVVPDRMYGASSIKASQSGTGRIFVAPCFFEDGVYELVVGTMGQGNSTLRLITKDAQINSFEIGDGIGGRPDDGLIYAPDVKKNKLVTINPDTGDVTVIADLGLDHDEGEDEDEDEGDEHGHATHTGHDQSGVVFDGTGMLWGFDSFNQTTILFKYVNAKDAPTTSAATNTTGASGGNATAAATNTTSANTTMAPLTAAPVASTMDAMDPSCINRTMRDVIKPGTLTTKDQSCCPKNAQAYLDNMTTADATAVLIGNKFGICCTLAPSDPTREIKSTKQIQPIFSASKWMAGYTMMRLVEEGVLSGGKSGKWTKLSEVFPDFWPQDAVADPKADIDLMHLLSQTSGITENCGVQCGPLPGGNRTNEGTAMFIAKNFTGTTPGAKFAYSESNFVLLGAMAVKKTGLATFNEVFRKYVGGPLGLDDSCGFTSTYGNQTEAMTDPGEGVECTAGDYMKFLGAVFNDKVLQSVDAELLRKMMEQPQTFGKDGAMGSGILANYGLGAWRECMDPSNCKDEKKTLVNSIGYAGFLPWVFRDDDGDGDHYGVVVRESNGQMAASFRVRDAVMAGFGHKDEPVQPSASCASVCTADFNTRQLTCDDITAQGNEGNLVSQEYPPVGDSFLTNPAQSYAGCGCSCTLDDYKVTPMTITEADEKCHKASTSNPNPIGTPGSGAASYYTAGETYTATQQYQFEFPHAIDHFAFSANPAPTLLLTGIDPAAVYEVDASKSGAAALTTLKKAASLCMPTALLVKGGSLFAGGNARLCQYDLTDMTRAPVDVYNAFDEAFGHAEAAMAADDTSLYSITVGAKHAGGPWSCDVFKSRRAFSVVWVEHIVFALSLHWLCIVLALTLH